MSVSPQFGQERRPQAVSCLGKLYRSHDISIEELDLVKSNQTCGSHRSTLVVLPPCCYHQFSVPHVHILSPVSIILKFGISPAAGPCLGSPVVLIERFPVKFIAPYQPVSLRDKHLRTVTAWSLGNLQLFAGISVAECDSCGPLFSRHVLADLDLNGRLPGNTPARKNGAP